MIFRPLTMFSICMTFLFYAQGAKSNVQAFKHKVQIEIVKGMQIANNDNNPIEYGEQGGSGDFKGKLDETYWQKIADYTFVLKPGKSAAKAIDAIFPTSRSQKEVRLECHSMMIAIIYRALKETMGVAKFDKIFNKRLIIKYGDLKASGLETFFLKDPIPKNQMEIGDWVYFQNNESYLHKHPDGPWQGENAVFIGKKSGENFYSGFGAADLSEKAMIKELQDAYNGSQTPGDLQILDSEWRVLQKWLTANSVFSKKNYFQLSSKLFKKVPGHTDPEDILEELFAPIAKKLGYSTVEVFASEFDYGVDEVAGEHLFWVEKIIPYPKTLSVSDIPGLVRIDRLDYQKLYSL